VDYRKTTPAPTRLCVLYDWFQVRCRSMYFIAFPCGMISLRYVGFLRLHQRHIPSKPRSALIHIRYNRVINSYPRTTTNTRRLPLYPYALVVRSNLVPFGTVFQPPQKSIVIVVSDITVVNTVDSLRSSVLCNTRSEAQEPHNSGSYLK
jgi:hypothetical protein